MKWRRVTSSKLAMIGVESKRRMTLALHGEEHWQVDKVEDIDHIKRVKNEVLTFFVPKDDAKKPEGGERVGRERKFNIVDGRRGSFDFQISY